MDYNTITRRGTDAVAWGGAWEGQSMGLCLSFYGGRRAHHQSTPSSPLSDSESGWNLGCVSALDWQGRTIWIADAHRDDGKRFVVRADEILTAFLELETAIRAAAKSSRPQIVEHF